VESSTTCLTVRLGVPWGTAQQQPNTKNDSPRLCHQQWFAVSSSDAGDASSWANKKTFILSWNYLIPTSN